MGTLHGPDWIARSRYRASHFLLCLCVRVLCVCARTHTRIHSRSLSDRPLLVPRLSHPFLCVCVSVCLFVCVYVLVCVRNTPRLGLRPGIAVIDRYCWYRYGCHEYASRTHLLFYTNTHTNTKITAHTRTHTRRFHIHVKTHADKRETNIQKTHTHPHTHTHTHTHTRTHTHTHTHTDAANRYETLDNGLHGRDFAIRTAKHLHAAFHGVGGRGGSRDTHSP